MSKTMSIYEAITRGTTVKNSGSARVKSDIVGVDAFATWRASQNKAFEALYKYADERRKTARKGKDAKMEQSIVDNAFVALQGLLDCIGEVNGHKVIKNDAMLNMVASCTMVNQKNLVGEALTQKSVVDNLKSEVKNIHTGMEAQYIEKITNDLEVAEIKYKELCKQANSCETKPVRVKANAFYLAIENELANICNEQDAMSWEELEARDAKLEAERKAKRKANKLSKKSAK